MTTTTAEQRITVEQVRAGQTVRFTGGHTRTIADVRMTAGYVYLQAVDDDGAPYALPVGSTVYLLDEPAESFEPAESILGVVFIGGHATRAELDRLGVICFGGTRRRVAASYAATFVPSGAAIDEAHAAALARRCPGCGGELYRPVDDTQLHRVNRQGACPAAELVETTEATQDEFDHLEAEQDAEGRAVRIVEELKGMQYRTDAVALLDELAALLAAR